MPVGILFCSKDQETWHQVHGIKCMLRGVEKRRIMKYIDYI